MYRKNYSVKGFAVHDCSVIGLFYRDIDKCLYFLLKDEDGVESILEFRSTEFWDLTSFEKQNVLFEIQEFLLDKIPKEIIDESVMTNWLEILDFVDRKFFYIDSSLGLRGYVIAERIILRKVRHISFLSI